MNHGYEHLLRPLTVGPLRLRNRIVASPTSIALLGDKGRITPEVIAYYEQKAAGAYGWSWSTKDGIWQGRR